ncbi:hypothetical protein ACFOWZ_10050 [Lentzea rhizosphaerae]|uniref:Uncharacterized protein n=1 Tax=Lentzea rhizosphaerae TaxID=2041025 RepID=A0ABV8BS91_9PSEU
MVAMIAFDDGEVTMRSGYFKIVIATLRARSTDPADLEVCDDSAAANCLWVDQIPAARKCAVVRTLHGVLDECLGSSDFAGNGTALFEFEMAKLELTERYPTCFYTA